MLKVGFINFDVLDIEAALSWLEHYIGNLCAETNTTLRKQRNVKHKNK